MSPFADAWADEPVLLPEVAVQTGGDNRPSQAVPAVGKTGTKLEDLPVTVTVVPHKTVADQGGTQLQDAIRDVSGISTGGGDGFGFSDRFLIRGLNPQVYADGFSEGDQRNGLIYSLNGVDHIEVLKGPGSALLGSGPPGGSINIVHALPSPILSYGAGVQFGSFDTLTSHYYATGATTTPGLNFRFDGLVAHSDGFRNLKSADYELRPIFTWALGDHFLTFSVDVRHLEHTPDPAGVVYFQGRPAPVSRDTKYSTPDSFANQDYIRTNLSDVWTATDYLTITNRFSYLHRSLDTMRNGDGSTASGISEIGRQLRQQSDELDDFDYQFEPVWKFTTGSVGHTLLTGLEARRQSLFTARSTADLPPIANIFAPSIPELSSTGLTFLSDASHSGFVDKLAATYLSAYATDQIDVTEKLKVRVGAREDYWDTDFNPQIFVPGRIFQGTHVFQPGVTYSRVDHPFSWNAGVLYKLLPGISPFAGVAKSNLANFTSESPQAAVHDPESALQYEVGVKAAVLEDRLSATVSAFDVTRNNVFVLVGDNGVFNDQRTHGIDLDIQAAPTPDWHIIANGTLQNAALIDNPSAPAAVGKLPIGVPRHIVNLFTTYDFAVGDIRGFQVGGGMTYRDKIFADQLNTIHVPAYAVFDAVLNYHQQHWDAAIGVKNIFDTLYFTNAESAGALVGDPRTVYAKLDVHF